MDIIGSVAADEVPPGERRIRVPGRWEAIVRRAIDDHQQQRVTVLRAKDDKELKMMRNGMAIPLRKHGYRARPVIVRDGNEIRVFLELALRVEKATEPVAEPTRLPVSVNSDRPVAEAWRGDRHA
jgi:hypothetical protein